MHDVLAVVVQGEAAVGEPDHAVGVRVLPGQEARAAPGAGRGGAERLAEEHALLGEPLDVRGPYRVPVGADPAAGVVRVDVEDVGKVGQVLRLSVPAADAGGLVLV